MSTRRRSTTAKEKSAPSSKAMTRKSPRKPPVKSKKQQRSDEEENTSSSYFKEAGGDESQDEEDDASDIGKKRRKSTATSIKSKKTATNKKRKLEDDDDEYSESEEPPKKVYDSDALDEDSDFDTTSKRKKKGRTSTSTSNASPKKTTSPKKKKQKNGNDEEEFEDLELADGQAVVGVVVQAPTTGRVPPGRISQNTFNFLTELKKPECNDREWFKLHEPVYRLAEKEWKDFIENFTDVLVEVDPQIPHLPTKDVIHRIYRDMRFSNDKTPYKAGFSASFSRSGRKGIFAHFKPGNESLIAAGSWCPGKNELATIRANIQRNSSRLRNIISAPEFVKFFGKPKPHPKGERQNIFGGEDELKTAPKGVAKDHKDIDLLKCRSFAVIHRFTDSEVLDPDFKFTLAKVAKVMQPFVHTLNDMMTITAGTNNNANDGDDEDEADEDADDEDADDEE